MKRLIFISAIFLSVFTQSALAKSAMFSESVTFNRTANTTTYSAGAVIGPAATSTIYLNAGDDSGSYFTIQNAWIKIHVNAIISGMTTFRLHFYNANPTAIADNGAFNVIAANRSSYLGYADCGGLVDLGDTLYANANSVSLTRELSASTNKIYCVVQTIGSFIPSSGMVFEVGISGSL